jgi:hypothetical protein
MSEGGYGISQAGWPLLIPSRDCRADRVSGTNKLGHADLRMTLGTYGHLFPDWDGDVADRMQKLWLRTKAA